MSQSVRIDYSNYFGSLDREMLWFLSTIDDFEWDRRMKAERELLQRLQIPLTLIIHVFIPLDFVHFLGFHRCWNEHFMLCQGK